jgi:hypothetical protein
MDFNLSFREGPQHTDVRPTARTATAEGEANPRGGTN